MASRIAALYVDLQLNTAKFFDSLDKSRSKSTLFGVAVGNILSGVAASAANMAVRVATSVPRAFLAAADSADQLFKSSQKIGISVEALSGLKHAAELSGVAFEQMETGVARLSRSMRDSLSGSNEAAKAYRALGVEVKNSDGTLRASEDVLRDLADRFSKMPDGANKTALAMTVLGRAGADLIPFLNQGAAGFDRMMQEAQKLGLVISTETAKAAEEFNDNLERLGKVTTGFANSLATAGLPALVSFTNFLTESAGGLGVFRDAIGLTFLPIKGLLELLTMLGGTAEMSGLRIKQLGGAAVLALRGDLELIPELWKQSQAEVDAVAERMLKTLAEISGVKPLDAIANDAKKGGAEIAEQLVENLKRQIKAGQAELDKLELRPRLLTGEIEKQVKDLGGLLDLDVTIKVPEADLSKFTAGWMETSLLMDGIREDMTLTTDAIEFLQTRQAAWNKTIEDLGLIQPELAKVEEGTWRISERGKEAGEAFEQLSHTITAGFEDAIVSGKGFRGILAGILEDIGKIILRATITGPEGVLGKILSVTLGSLFGGGGGGGGKTPTHIFGPGFAEGGFVGTSAGALPAILHAGEFVLQRAAVQRLGIPALEKLNLGVKLPEFQFGGPVAPGMLIPSMSGQAVPGGTVVNEIYNIDARGADAGVEQRVRRAIQFAHADAVKRSVALSREIALRTP